jgi:hypothetical protein
MAFISFHVNEVNSYRTDAKSGQYIGQSNINCACCGKPIKATTFVCVDEGHFTPSSVDKVADQLAEMHTEYPLLTAVEWLGDGRVEFVFSNGE